MKVAINQPYLFPYIGYFKLINAVDYFVFYDDVQYIKNGFINRNYLLVNKAKCGFTVPVQMDSHKDSINTVKVSFNDKWLLKFSRTLAQNYSKAPYFDEVYQLVQRVFEKKSLTISELAISSVIEVLSYLMIDTKVLVSSKNFPETKGMDRADRLIEITKKVGGKVYINPSGGKDLYFNDYFSESALDLKFIDSISCNYPQFDNDFVSNLSIIDVLMFNSAEDAKKILSLYKLV